MSKTSGSSNTITFTPTSTTTLTPSNTIFVPGNGNVPNVQPTGSSITIGAPDPRYAVFMLPEKDVMPNKVYVSGMLLTVGILGSDVQAAFVGDKLIFAPGVLTAMILGGQITVSIDYGKWLYHYNIETEEFAFGKVAFEENSNVVVAKIISKVEQK